MLPNYGAAKRFKNIPATTEHSLVFPLNPFTYEFEMTEFKPEMTQNILSVKEVKDFLIGLEKIIKHYKQQLNKKATFKWYCISIGLISLGALVNAVLFPVTQAIACLFIGMALLFLGVLMFFFATSKYSSFQKKIQNGVRDSSNKFITKKKEKYEDKGYRWKLPGDYPKWVEMNLIGGEADMQHDSTHMDAETLKHQGTLGSSHHKDTSIAPSKSRQLTGGTKNKTKSDGSSEGKGKSSGSRELSAMNSGSRGDGLNKMKSQETPTNNNQLQETGFNLNTSNVMNQTKDQLLDQSMGQKEPYVTEL